MAESALQDVVEKALSGAGISAERARKVEKMTLQDKRPESTKLATAEPETHEKAAEKDFVEAEQGPDEVVLKHAEDERVKAVLEARDRKVKLAALVLLTAADSLHYAGVRRHERQF